MRISKISKYSIGLHQMCIIAFSYNILKKTVLEKVGNSCKPVNLFFYQLERKLVNLRMYWHSEISCRFYGGNWNEEVAEIRRSRERSERVKEIKNLRQTLLEENIEGTKIPAGIKEYEVGELRGRRVSV